eukprot:CAMPEP_0179454860 /NCGR_PEP_ID=MMETSP0799-20121207/38825_1 /TAXON_ID=46947 /ORGANISM="Geminigera cryophila, Strain CCMP2564" /LENGTH=117 /DNA_ID=CAMNT_0021253363 /DNA_START=83 /DNA_END=432 /DNA_ORIENTATION=+
MQAVALHMDELFTPPIACGLTRHATALGARKDSSYPTVDSCVARRCMRLDLQVIKQCWHHLGFEVARRIAAGARGGSRRLAMLRLPQCVAAPLVTQHLMRSKAEALAETTELFVTCR